nr:pentatricopeptide repeat-containing protein, mitochondrial [Quercus suber]
MSLVYVKRNAVIAIWKWKEEGHIVRKYDLNRIVRQLRKLRHYKHALEIRGGSAGIIESLYGVVKPISILNKSTEVRPSEKIGSGTTEIPFSMFLRPPGKDNLERFYETFHGANISAQINLNAGDARTDASAVEDKPKIDASTVKGKTTIPRAEHEVTCNPGTVTESGSIQCPISKAQCEQLLAFLNASCNSGENHHVANVSIGNGLANLGSGVFDVCSSAGVPATAAVAATKPHPQAYNSYLETMSGNDVFVTPITIQDESITCSDSITNPIPVQVSSLHSDSSPAAFDSTDSSVPILSHLYQLPHQLINHH